MVHSRENAITDVEGVRANRGRTLEGTESSERETGQGYTEVYIPFRERKVRKRGGRGWLSEVRRESFTKPP